MMKKSLLALAIVILTVCCCSLAFGQMIKEFDGKGMWMYHPDKDKNLGSYEWWYMDAQLENGYLLAIMFGVPNQFLEPYNKYLSDASKLYPVPPYDPKNFAAVEFSITDAKGKVVFDGYEDVKPKDMSMPTKKNMVVKFNNCRLEWVQKEKLPTFVFTMNIKDRDGKGSAKAKLVLNSLVPTVMAGRPHHLDAVSDGKRFYHDWLVLTATSKVKAEIEFTNKETGKVTKVKETGMGYHDKNYGNHACTASMKGWIWAKVAEPDLTILFAEVPTIFTSLYPTAQPFFVIYKGNIVAATEAFDIVKGPAGKFRLPYPTETTLVFKPESGIKGTLRFHDLKLVNCYEGSAYSRWLCSYSLDVESPKYGKIKRDGTAMYEYTDFTVK